MSATINLGGLVASALAASLNDKQRAALLWAYADCERQWYGSTDGLTDPSPSTLVALIKRGLMVRSNPHGLDIRYTLTDEGRATRAWVDQSAREKLARKGKA